MVLDFDLRIAIVGAGLAGLTAAVSLRRQGHDVQIFESSRMNKEIGAAIALSANSLRVLTYLGFDVKHLRALDYLGVMWYGSQGGDGAFDPLKDPLNTFDRPALLCHRSDLHEELKRLATTHQGPGKPVAIHLGCETMSCDSSLGLLTLKSGETHEADVIIGADGIHSVIRTSVLGYEQIAPLSGRAAFRCLLDASKLEGRPEFAWIFSGQPGPRGVQALDASGRYLFVYPCRDGTLINIVAHYPDLRDQDKFSWNALVTKEEMVGVFKDFHSQFTGLLALADGPVHLWQIRSLPRLPTWIKGCIALIGDAAHATFPTIGQGAGMSIEDAVTIGCLLPLGTAKEQVPVRLEAYQTLRKDRGEFVSTESVEQVMVPSKRGLYGKSEEMQAQIIGHDAVKVAQEYFANHFAAK
ncbi:FAD/NAD(P)-binding domain-containing protein [Mycena sp. CBHHK59/15]|nr:FAD/NAD(P)-binding domain-containing protein [Mycena sp. CBHHK59/15]